jgi:hypothetical protein
LTEIDIRQKARPLPGFFFVGGTALQRWIAKLVAPHHSI